MSSIYTRCQYTPYYQALLRVVVAVLFICHGTQKLFNYPSGDHGAMPPLSLPGIAALLELIGGLFFLIGLLTRPVAFILSGEMAVAYFMVHFKMAWWPIHNHGELAVLFCFVFFFFSAAGAGAWSVDDCIYCRKCRDTETPVAPSTVP